MKKFIKPNTWTKEEMYETMTALERMTEDLARQLRIAKIDLQARERDFNEIANKLRAREELIVGLKEDLRVHIDAWKAEKNTRIRQETSIQMLMADLIEARSERNKYAQTALEARDIADDLDRANASYRIELKDCCPKYKTRGGK